MENINLSNHVSSRSHARTIMRCINIIMLLVCIVCGVAAQGNIVTGTVVDNSGEPVIGANVLEKGTTNGTVTDTEGKFSINVQNGAVLQISYIGYNTQEISALAGGG